MPSSTSPSCAELAPYLPVITLAGLCATVVLSVFGLSQAAIHWQREAGFAALDLWRVLGAATVFGGLPAMIAALGAAWLGRLEDTSRAARLVFWSVPALAVAVAAALMVASPAAEQLRMPWWLLPASAGLLLVLGWRTRLFWRVSAAIAPTGWMIIAASFPLAGLDWGPAPMRFKGPLVFVMVGALLAIGLTGLALVRREVADKPRAEAFVCALAVVVALVAAAWLPWVLIDSYGFSKLMVAFCAAMVAAHLVTMSAFVREEGCPTSRLSWGASGERPHLPTLVGACAISAGIAGAGWFVTQPVDVRFGGFERNALVGLVATVGSAASDADDGDAPALAEADDLSAEPVEVAGVEPTLDEPIDHVIVIVVDSMRADLIADAELRSRFGLLDRLEAESVRFNRAYSPSNNTRLSLAPMFTGVDPSVFAALVDHDETRGETFRDHWIGEIAGADGASALIFTTPFAWMLGEHFAVDSDVRVLDGRVDELGHTAPYFVDHFQKMVDDGFFDNSPTVTAAYIADPHSEFTCRDGTEGGWGCFLEEIEKVDEALGQIYDALEAAGVLDRALFVVTADHGQSFGQMNYRGHATTIDDEAIHVGLLMRLPDGRRRVVDQPVSLMSLTATVADALHRRPTAAQAYDSLLPLAVDDPDARPQPVTVDHFDGYYVHLPTHQTALIFDDHRLVYDWHTDHATLVELSDTPEAGSDLSDDHPERTEELVDELFEWREHVQRVGAGAVELE